MAANIYEKHDRAFANVSAFAILRDGKHVANITTKRGNAVTAYVHWIGDEMQTGTAQGGGYDRQSAAASYAAAKIPLSMGANEPRDAFRLALLEGDNGNGWARKLESAGFTICNVIS